MKSNYKKLGDYIQLVDVRNKDLLISNLLGVSIQKKFIHSIANVSDTDMSVYRVVKKDQFAFSPVTSRNGDKFTIALLKEVESAIISPAYQVFEIINKNLLLPEYLIIFLNRAEFDRYTRFNSWGSARETFTWEDVCNIDMSIPDIEIQKDVVAVYSELLRNQKSYEGSLDDLQLICDTFIEDLIKKKNSIKVLGGFIKELNNKNINGEIKEVCGVSNNKKLIPTRANMRGVDLLNYKIVRKNQFVYRPVVEGVNAKISIAIRTEQEPCIVSSIYPVFEIENNTELLPEFLFLFFKRSEFDRYTNFYSWGSARETFDFEDMCEVRLPIPCIDIQKSIVAIHHVLESRRKINEDLKNIITSLCPVLMKGVVDTLTLR